ncbi:MAG: AAA family ATPase [Candidatus Saccharimonadales bacterium]|nr:AAA family ATPase [Candidatus Saccharimonadales bacterium]
MKSNTLVLGAAGTFGSGKDTVGEYLAENYGFFHVSTSDTLRAESQRRHNSIERAFLLDTGNDLRRQRGGGVLAEMALEKYKTVAADHPSGVVISAIRTIGEVNFIKSQGGLVIFTDAPAKLRYQRIIDRKRDKNETTFSFKEFQQSEEKELAGSDNDAKPNILGIKEIADYHLDNSGSLEDFHKQIEDVVTTLRREVQ